MSSLLEKITKSLPSVLQDIFKGGREDPMSLINSLPKGNPMRATLQNKMETIKQEQAEIKRVDDDAKKVIYDPNTHYGKYMQLLEVEGGKDGHLLSENAKFELAWVKYNQNPTENKTESFQTYVMHLLKTKMDSDKRDMLLAHAAYSGRVENDLRVLLQVNSNQKYMYDIMQKWEVYLDTQLKEKDKLLKKLQALHSTQKRESLFNVQDIKSMSKWKKRVDVAFMLVIAVLFLALVIKLYTPGQLAKFIQPSKS